MAFGDLGFIYLMQEYYYSQSFHKANSAKTQFSGEVSLLGPNSNSLSPVQPRLISAPGKLLSDRQQIQNMNQEKERIEKGKVKYFI